MKKEALKAEALLLLASAIWGSAFVAQRAGMEYLGPFLFNSLRFALGSLILIPVILAGRSTGRWGEGERRPAGVKTEVAGGLTAGTVLFLGASLQQAGMKYTTAGKGGFITGLYVILVPILGLALGHRPGKLTWGGAVLATGGLYLLSFTGEISVNSGDLLVLASTFFWAVHVLLIGWLTTRVRPLRLASLQFAACSLFSLVAALGVERLSLEGIRGAAVPILYGGILSVGIAYTLQVVAQRKTPPSHAAIILSLETVFAALAGWLVLAERIPPVGMLGCALMLGGILTATRDRIK
ncbi:MAG: DMT family transporter [Candidatus Krumholzibacteriota bacterium]|nr:DMT family transporter [Candidatus Krumholzibacteriota bacterium]